MYNVLHKIAVALATLWLEVNEETVDSSTYYVYAEDVETEDGMPDIRLSGHHLEVTVKVVKNDAEYEALFVRHLARQGVNAHGAVIDSI